MSNFIAVAHDRFFSRVRYIHLSHSFDACNVGNLCNMLVRILMYVWNTFVYALSCMYEYALEYKWIYVCVRLNEDVHLYICMALMIKSVLALVVVLLLLSLRIWLLLLPLLMPILLAWLWLWFLLLSQLLLPLCMCICSRTCTSQYVHVFAYGPKTGAAFLRFSLLYTCHNLW